MTTHWFERTPDGPAIGQTTVEPLPEEPTTLLIHQNVPDWICCPMTGQKARVLGTREFSGPCPKCQQALAPQLLLIAERPDHPEGQFVVYECPTDGFVFTGERRS